MTDKAKLWLPRRAVLGGLGSVVFIRPSSANPPATIATADNRPR